MTDTGESRRLGQVTLLLRSWHEGDPRAFGELMPIVYGELRRIAHRYAVNESAANPLQTTEIVHEAYLRLVDSSVDWQGRRHFFAVAARAMRRILVDRARRASAAKRGDGLADLPLIEVDAAQAPKVGMLDLDAALTRLEAIDERKSRVVELRFFAGMTTPEAARALEISTATVERDLRVAKAWLAKEVAGAAGEG